MMFGYPVLGSKIVERMVSLFQAPRYWGEDIAVDQVQINLDALITVFLFSKQHAFLSFLSRTTSQVQPELQKQKSQIPLCCSKLRRFWAKSSLIT